MVRKQSAQASTGREWAGSPAAAAPGSQRRMQQTAPAAAAPASDEAALPTSSRWPPQYAPQGVLCLLAVCSMMLLAPCVAHRCCPLVQSAWRAGGHVEGGDEAQDGGCGRKLIGGCVVWSTVSLQQTLPASGTGQQFQATRNPFCKLFVAETWETFAAAYSEWCALLHAACCLHCQPRWSQCCTTLFQARMRCWRGNHCTAAPPPLQGAGPPRGAGPVLHL